MRISPLIVLACFFPLFGLAAQPSEKFAPVPYDPFVGDWLPKKTGDYVAQVFATGSNAYQANVLVAFDDESSAEPVVVLRGTRPDEKSAVELSNISGDWTGTIRPDCCGSPQMEIANSKTGEKVRLSQFMRPNPRLRAKPPEGASELFADRMRDGVVMLAKDQAPLVFSGKFSNARVHLEFRILGEQSAGIVTVGHVTTIALSSSYGRNYVTACGAMGREAPVVRAERALLEWQALDIDVIPDDWKVLLNGVQIHKKTYSCALAFAGGVLKIETSGQPVEFRNIWVLAKE